MLSIDVIHDHVFLLIDDTADRADKDKVYRAKSLLEAVRSELLNAALHLDDVGRLLAEIEAINKHIDSFPPRERFKEDRPALARKARLSQHFVTWNYAGYATSLAIARVALGELSWVAVDAYLAPHMDTDAFTQARKQLVAALKSAPEMRNILVHRENNFSPKKVDRAQTGFQSAGLVATSGNAEIVVTSAILHGVHIEATGKDQTKITLPTSIEFFRELQTQFAKLRVSFAKFESGDYYKDGMSRTYILPPAS